MGSMYLLLFAIHLSYATVRETVTCITKELEIRLEIQTFTTIKKYMCLLTVQRYSYSWMMLYLKQMAIWAAGT